MRVKFYLAAVVIAALGFASCNKNAKLNQSEGNTTDSVSVTVFNLGNGVNVSHWLSQSPIRGVERDSMITKKDFDSIAAMGFNHVRLPIDEEQLYDEQMNHDESGFKLLHNAIQWSLENNLNIIVDLHILRSYHFNSENSKPNSLFENKEDQEKFLSIWLDLQKELKSYPNDRVAYEILNEPNAPSFEVWNNFVAKFIETIRKEEPNRMLVIGANYWQVPSSFAYLSVPANDKNLILSFHFYSPLLITHYRAPWSESTKYYTGGVNYPGLIVQDTTSYKDLTEEQRAQMRTNNIVVNIETLENELEPAIHLADSLGLQLYCGEFGAYPRYIDKEIRLRWYDDIVTIFRKHNIANAHWCYKGDFPVVKKEDGSANELPAILTRK